MDRNSRIYIAGHSGLVGSAIKIELEKRGFSNLIYRRSVELDLRKQEDVRAFFQEEGPEYIFFAAAKVGGIYANMNYPAEFIYDNLIMECNIIHSAYVYGVKKLIFLGSSCIYPKFAPQPIKEEYLLTGSLEPTNEPYAIAKIAGIKMVESYNRQYNTNFISAMPTNLYGLNDNFDLTTSHVLPALIRKFHEAKINNSDSVTIWGTGMPLREFLYVDDLVDALIFLMERVNSRDVDGIVNIGVGKDITIKELAEMIADIVGYKGELIFDSSKPDGTPRKLLDISRMESLGWKARTSLRKGIEQTYEWFKEQYEIIRGR